MNIIKLFKGSSGNMSQNKVQSLVLIPDRPSLTYNSGELITGHCILTVEGTIDFSQIQIKLSGKADTQLPNNDNNHRSNHRSNSADKSLDSPYVTEHLEIVKLIYNPATVYNSALTTGRHDIGFSFHIPPNVPSSLSYQYGWIKYKLKARVEGNESKNAVLDLNIISSPAVSPNELFAPICLANDKTVGLIGGKRVQLKCDIPKTGFTLGGSIPITCSIANQSKKFMDLRATLKQEITFKARLQSQTETNKLTVSDGPQIGPKSEASHSLSLMIPVNLPIVHNTCQLISIKYIVSVKLVIPGSFNLYCKMPVILTNQLLPN